MYLLQNVTQISNRFMLIILNIYLSKLILIVLDNDVFLTKKGKHVMF